MVRYIVFFIITFFMGFLSAIPVGAVQVEAARRALSGHLRAALMVSAGALTADLFYGIIAVYGLLPVLQQKKLMAYFWLFGGFFIILLGIRLFLQGLQTPDLRKAPHHIRHRGIAFFTGLSLGITNPMMILWWLIGERILMELGIVKSFTGNIAWNYLLFGGAGMFSYPCILSFTLYLLHRSLPQRFIMRISTFSALLLFVFALYMIVKSLIIIL